MNTASAPGLGLGFAYRNATGEGDDIRRLPTDNVTTLQIPGIYSDPGGFISNQAELLRLSMGGAPTNVSEVGMARSGAAAFPLDKNTVWLIAGVIVAAVVVSKR